MGNADDFQSLCCAIGFVEINWALFEQSLDFIVITAFQDLGGSALEKELPRSYSRKVKFLRKAFAKVTVLNPLNAEASEILSRSERLSGTRHDLMHGVVTHIQPIDSRYTFSKIDYAGNGHSYRDVVFNPADFPTLADELLRLGKDTTHLGLKVDEIQQRLARR